MTDPQVRDRMPADSFKALVEELEMLDAAGEAFDEEAVLAGDMTPVFFGSALNNFGVQLLLDAFLQHAPPPGPRQAGELASRPTIRNSPGSSSRSSRTWTRTTATRSRSCASARACSRAT